MAALEVDVPCGGIRSSGAHFSERRFSVVGVSLDCASWDEIMHELWLSLVIATPRYKGIAIHTAVFMNHIPVLYVEGFGVQRTLVSDGTSRRLSENENSRRHIWRDSRAIRATVFSYTG